MLAETWVDFERDALYLSFDFCLAALEGLPTPVRDYYLTGRKEPYGYFLKELSQDIQKVKDLAISGIWALGSQMPWQALPDLVTIVELFGNLVRVTLIDAHHAPDRTADLVYADKSPYVSYQVRDPDYHDLMAYRDFMFGRWWIQNFGIWHGLEPYPGLEFGTLVERRNVSSMWSSQYDCNTSGIRPLRTGSRLATEEDCQRAIPDFSIRVWRGWK